MYIHIYIYIYTHAYRHMMCIYIYIYAYTYTSLSLYIYICLYTYISLSLYIYIYIFIHIHDMCVMCCISLEIGSICEFVCEYMVLLCRCYVMVCSSGAATILGAKRLRTRTAVQLATPELLIITKGSLRSFPSVTSRNETMEREGTMWCDGT